MKQFSLFAFFLSLIFLPGNLAAQSQQIERLLAVEPFPIQWLDTSGLAPDERLLHFDFGGSKLLNPAEARKMREQTITDIYYVFSAYTLSEEKQGKLNRRRFESLAKAVPGILDDPAISWTVVEQVGPDNADDAAKLFHGFLVRFRPPADSAFAASEIETIEKAIKCGLLPAEKAPVFPGGKKAMFKKLNETIPFPSEIKTKGRTRSKISFRVAPNGQPYDVRFPRGVNHRHDSVMTSIISDLNGWKNGDSSVIFTLLVSYNVNPDGKKTVTFNGIRANVVVPCLTTAFGQVDNDSTVFKIFDRHPDWDKMLIVHDITGSMSPYTTQVLQWFALQGNFKKTKRFVFFNDGDKTSDSAKVIGETGGIYEAEAQNLEKVKDMLFKGMRNGSGGDLPENNIEALLLGLKNCPECKETVMIADNFAPPRDLELAEKIGRPVRIIVCGARGFVHPAYLYLAWKTKGSVHTMKSDIEALAKMQEGQKISIEGKEYLIQNGRFIHVRKG